MYICFLFIRANDKVKKSTATSFLKKNNPQANHHSQALTPQPPILQSEKTLHEKTLQYDKMVKAGTGSSEKAKIAQKSEGISLPEVKGAEG